MSCLVRIWATLLLSSLYAGGHAFCKSSIQSDVSTGVVVEIRSPFDLSRIEIEEAPRGAVTLIRLREGKKQTWMLGPAYWRIKSRPGSADFSLSSYERGTELAKAGKLIEAGEVWTEAALRNAG
jgi:hypothetical protein